MARRRRVWWIGAAVALAVVGGLWWWRGRSHPKPRIGFIVAFQAVDADSAIVVWRLNTHPVVTCWVGRIDSKGHTVWVQALPAESFNIGPYDGVTIAGDVVAVRYGHGEHARQTDQSVAAFSLRDGHALWDVVLTPYHAQQFEGVGQSEPGLEIYASSLAVGDGLIAEWASDGKQTTLYGLDAATGKVLSRTPVDASLYEPRRMGTRVLETTVEYTLLVEAARQAAPQQIASRFAACPIGDELVTLVLDSNDPPVASLVAFRGGDPAAKRVIATPFRPLKDAPGALLHVSRCGRYGDRLVLLLGGHDESFEPQSYVVITDAAGSVLHVVDLGHDMQWDGDAYAKRFPEAAPLAGELPRYVPYPQHVHGEGEPDVTRLVMLDLEDGNVAWTGPNDPELIQMSLFRAGTRWYTFWPNSSWILSVFDGTTGKLSAAAQLYDYEGIGEIAPYHVAGDRIWVHNGDHTSVDSAAYAVLNASTLAPLFARGVKVTDVTAKARATLGHE